MPFAVGNRFQMINFFRQGTIQGVMVSYWTLATYAGTNSDAELAEAMHFQVANVARVVDVMNSFAELYKTVLNNLDQPLLFGEFEQGIQGEASGEALPSFNALQVKQIVPTRLTRNGYKRIPFLAEVYSIGNEPVIPVAARTALEAFYGGETVVNYTGDGFDVDAEIFPIVIGRTNVGTPEAPVYELDLDKVQVVTGASVTKITHQISRDS